MLAASLWSSPGLAAVLTANDDNYTTAINTDLHVAAPGILSNDLGFITGVTAANFVTGPAHGFASLNGATGEFGYSPFFGFTGVDFVTYNLSDVVTSNTATIRIEVGAAATPLPAALPLFATGLGALGLMGWRRKNKAALAA